LIGLFSSFPIFLSLIAAQNNTGVTVVRWADGNPGCTFSADDDGKYRYGIWTDDWGLVIAVDADEVRKTKLRIEPLFALWITVHYRGNDDLLVNPAEFTLEFVDHYHTLQKAVDPDEFAGMLQAKESAGSNNKTQKTSLTETAQFVKSHALRAIRLDGQNSQASGWIFFSAKSKWIGNWKAQEQFVLRAPIGARALEFPFALPPGRGDLLLRRR